jgi:hypothetical protein
LNERNLMTGGANAALRALIQQDDKWDTIQKDERDRIGRIPRRHTLRTTGTTRDLWLGIWTYLRLLVERLTRGDPVLRRWDWWGQEPTC